MSESSELQDVLYFIRNGLDVDGSLLVNGMSITLENREFTEKKARAAKPGLSYRYIQ